VQIQDHLAGCLEEIGDFCQLNFGHPNELLADEPLATNWMQAH